MKKSASYWRKMLREQLSPFGIILTDQGVLDSLNEWWSDRRENVATLFITFSRLAYGDHAHLEEALRLMNDDPDLVGEVPARAFVRAIDHLLPLPEGVTSLEPQTVLDWYRIHKNELAWNEEQGHFVVVASSDHSPRSIIRKKEI